MPNTVNEVRTYNIETQLLKLTSLVRQVVVGLVQHSRVCGIHSVQDYSNDMCPQVQDDIIPQVIVVSKLINQPRKYDHNPHQYTLV